MWLSLLEYNGVIKWLCKEKKLVTQGARILCVVLYIINKKCAFLQWPNRSWLLVQMIWNETWRKKNTSMKYSNWMGNTHMTNQTLYMKKTAKNLAKCFNQNKAHSENVSQRPKNIIIPKKYWFDSDFAIIFIYTCVSLFNPLPNSNNMLVGWLVQSNTSIFLNHFYVLFLSTLLVISFFFFRNGYLFPSKVYA